MFKTTLQICFLAYWALLCAASMNAQTIQVSDNSSNQEFTVQLSDIDTLYVIFGAKTFKPGYYYIDEDRPGFIYALNEPFVQYVPKVGEEETNYFLTFDCDFMHEISLSYSNLIENSKIVRVCCELKGEKMTYRTLTEKTGNEKNKTPLKPKGVSSNY
jgi:hypothetical protein